MRSEFQALRRIARLVSDYLELDTTQLREAVAGRAMLEELRMALDDLRLRFPYTLEPPSLDGGLRPARQPVVSREPTRR